VAGLSISMSVTPKGGAPRVVTAEPVDMVAFERTFSKSIAKLQDEVFLTDLFWLAWHSEKRTGATGLEFDPWVETLETIDVSGEEDELVPLESPPIIGSSAS
jgi:hypothetical protein